MKELTGIISGCKGYCICSYTDRMEVIQSLFGKDAYKMEFMEEQANSREQKNAAGFFLTPTFQALTIGVPFCIFKLLFGMLALRMSEQVPSVSLYALGWMIIAWAALDFLMNMACVFFNLTGRNSPIEYCVIAQAGKLIGRPKLFLAIDTFISFFIICFVLWSGWIVSLSQEESYIWYAATTLNLISISIVNIWIELCKGS